KFISVIILLLATIGVPTAAAFTFADKVTQNPLISLALAILYEIIVFFATIFSKILQRLEKPWLDEITQKIDTATRSVISRYKKRYMEYTKYRYRDFDMKGITTQ